MSAAMATTSVAPAGELDALRRSSGRSSTVSPVHEYSAATATATRDRVLADHELRAIWDAAGDQLFPSDGVLRSNCSWSRWRAAIEVCGTEMDVRSTVKARTWTVPADRMKNHQNSTSRRCPILRWNFLEEAAGIWRPGLSSCRMPVIQTEPSSGPASPRHSRGLWTSLDFRMLDRTTCVGQAQARWRASG